MSWLYWAPKSTTSTPPGTAAASAGSSAGVWVEVEEERLLVCTVSEVLGVLEELGVCPYCEGKGLPGGDSCPVCGRTAEPTGPE